VSSLVTFHNKPVFLCECGILLFILKEQEKLRISEKKMVKRNHETEKEKMKTKYKINGNV